MGIEGTIIALFNLQSHHQKHGDPRCQNGAGHKHATDPPQHINGAHNHRAGGLAQPQDHAVQGHENAAVLHR